MTEQFDSLQKAQDTMRIEMIQFGKVPAESFEYAKDEEHCGKYEDVDCTYGFDAYGGYANDGIYHHNYDWKIVEIVSNT